MTDFIEVNQKTVGIADAIRRSNFRDGEFLRHAIDDMLLLEYAASKNISNTDEELQVAADEFRYMRGLESVAAFNRWMKDNHLTVEAVQDGLDIMLIRNKAVSSMPQSDVEAHFAEHQLDFERVELYSIRTDSEGKAKEIAELAREDPGSFHSLAMEHSTDDKSRAAGGYIGSVARNEVTGVIEAAVFGATPGTIIGPVKTDKGFNVFKVGNVARAKVEDHGFEIRRQLFDSVMEKLRNDAKISIRL